MENRACKLKVSDLFVNYGSIRALKGVNLEVYEGEIVTLIGANGAGKTTTMHTIMGVVKATEGDILYDGNSIIGKSTRERVKNGIVISPEGRQIFPELTVEDNLYVGGMDLKKDIRKEEMGKVFNLFPILEERKSQLAGTLSGGEQQMLAVGRALMGQPKLLLLDEPSLGLAPLIIKEIFDLIIKIRDTTGVSILFVEQNAKMALKVSDRAYVIETGVVVTSGNSKELANSEEIKKAYLGG